MDIAATVSLDTDMCVTLCCIVLSPVVFVQKVSYPPLCLCGYCCVMSSHYTSSVQFSSQCIWHSCPVHCFLNFN